jgi:hypothetical protein
MLHNDRKCYIMTGNVAKWPDIDTKWPETLQNDRKRYKMTGNVTKWPEMSSHLISCNISLCCTKWQSFYFFHFLMKTSVCCKN